MRFLMMVKGNKDTEAGVMPGVERLTAMGEYNDALMKAGVLLDGAGLHPTSRGARVLFSDAGVTVVDGPFTESKEIIAGYWLVEVKSREEAIEWARRCPHPHGHGPAEIELRPLFEAKDFAEAPAGMVEKEEAFRAKQVRA
jgi:hypothetical protein